MIKEKFAALASQWCVHTTKSEGDCRRHCVYERSKRFLALLCIPQTLSIMYFPALPAEHRGLDVCVHTHTSTSTTAYSSAWHLTRLSAENLRSKHGYRLTATLGLVKVAGWVRTLKWQKGSKT